MADEPVPTRSWIDLSQDEQAVIKLLYVNGVHSIGQLARTWCINYNTLKHVVYRHKWPEEKDKTAVSLDHNVLAHTKFMQKVFLMMENIQQGYEELLSRHQLYDSFTAFPFDAYFAFLETYAKVVNSLGGVKSVSQDMHLHLQQNNLQQNVNIGADGQQPEIGQVTDRSAQVLVRKLIENMVLTQRPPQQKEIQANTVKPDDEPDPAQGKFR